MVEEESWLTHDAYFPWIHDYTFLFLLNVCSSEHCDFLNSDDMGSLGTDLFKTITQ